MNPLTYVVVLIKVINTLVLLTIVLTMVIIISVMFIFTLIFTLEDEGLAQSGQGQHLSICTQGHQWPNHLK